MSFLTIPSQQGLFVPVKAGKSAEDGRSACPVEDDRDDDDEDEDDEDGEVRFAPRCSPIPKKRGQSIFDEHAEYMRIHLSLPAARRRVSFADTTGGDLVDVREFVAFDSDEEDAAEDACYRKHPVEPTYRINTEFSVATGSALAEAVQTNKVAVELLAPVANEPMAFSGLIRVLNISYHKAVYIRSTMDHWATFFDHPAEYVQASNDDGGRTDAFGFKLSFAPPYDTHGSRIEFVVRYETSEGDFWANNSHMNYVVTLLVSYEEHLPETADDPFGSPLPPDQEFQSVDDAQCDDASMPHRSPCTSSRKNTADQSLHLSSHVCTSTLQMSSDSQSLPSLPRKLDNQNSEHLEDGPLRPHTPSSLAEGVEQKHGSFPLDELKPFTVTVTEASVHFSGEINEEDMLHMTLGDRKIKIAHFLSRAENEKEPEGGADVSVITNDETSSTKEHFDAQFNERQSENNLQKEPSLDNVLGNLRSFEMEETLQTVPPGSFNNLGIPKVPFTAKTLLSAASVMLSEQQSPYTSSKKPHCDPFQTSMTTKMEHIDTAHSCMSKQLELISTNSETEQDLSVEGRRETQAVLRSPSDHPSDKEQNTSTDQMFEEQATLGDTAAFSENGEMVQQATARSDIGETNWEGSSAHQSTDKPFLVQFGTSVQNDTLCRPYSEATTTQTPLVDPDVVFSDAYDSLTETSPRPAVESTDSVSSDTWFTPTAPESPPSHVSPPSVRPGKIVSRCEAVEMSRPRPERNAGGSFFRLGAVLLCAVTCVSVVLNDPGYLFYLGLALVALFFLITSD
ncbi:hypothetical protein NHX12_012532 [Muraenolepis orangiensis]|uniref:CBM21 domain-containing protein n=1 Tax=Muraenolepis orangiensis TaxID=630683 RepID=A0A9Q0DD14_9TELE|nr:hypothetical protein NHX12_012532 [Muraenolepis orangiensis]